MGFDPDGTPDGKLKIGDLELFHWSAPRPPDPGNADEPAAKYAGRAVLDAPGKEAAVLSYASDQDPTTAQIGWIDGQELGNVESYLTAGARVGFVRGWQQPTKVAEKLARKLFAASIPRDTPEDAVVAALVTHGLVQAEATALVRWLGQDAVILLPR